VVKGNGELSGKTQPTAQLSQEGHLEEKRGGIEIFPLGEKKKQKGAGTGSVCGVWVLGRNQQRESAQRTESQKTPGPR